MTETLILSICYLVGTIWAPTRARRQAPRHARCEPDTMPLPILPVTAIYGIPMNPLVKL